MRLAAALVVVALAAPPAAAEVLVRVAEGRVDLTATAAPLAEVLDRLARQTGMKVVYEGPAPRQLVTLSLHGRTPSEAVLSVLEGLGLNFALVADPTGVRVQTLVLAGAPAASSPSASAGAGRAPAPANPRRPFGAPPGSSPEPVEPAFPDGDEDTEPDEPGFAGLPAGAEMTDPSGTPLPPDPTLANPAAQAPSVPPPGAGQIPTQPSSSFSSSPFMPQPQPFPPVPPGAPTAPGTTTEEAPPATSPPQ